MHSVLLPPQAAADRAAVGAGRQGTGGWRSPRADHPGRSTITPSQRHVKNNPRRGEPRV